MAGTGSGIRKIVVALVAVKPLPPLGIKEITTLRPAPPPQTFFRTTPQITTSLSTELHERTYFDVSSGRAEANRIVFTALGIQFKHVRLKGAEFGAKKQEGLHLTGLPIVKVGDTEYTHSVANLRNRWRVPRPSCIPTTPGYV